MTRWPILLLCLLACTLGLAACGGDDDEDATALLAQTFGGEGEDVKSGRLGVNLRLDAKGFEQIQGPVALRLSGPFASTDEGKLPRFDFNLSLDAGGQAIQAGAVSTGDRGFVRFQNEAYEVGKELFDQFQKGYAEQAKCAEEKGSGGVSFESLGIDPRRWLREAVREGEEEVGGAETVHIRTAIDVPRFLEDINRVLGRTDLQRTDPCAEEQADQPRPEPGRQLSAQDRKSIAEAIKDARMDVWTGPDDKIMRRMNVALRFDVPEASRERANGLTSGQLRFDLTIGAVNEEQRIAAPRGAQPLDALVQRFGGQVPGLGSGAAPGGAAPGAGTAPGGTGATPAPAPTAPGASGGGSSEYLECVQQAGQDVKKLQACAELVGG